MQFNPTNTDLLPIINEQHESKDVNHTMYDANLNDEIMLRNRIGIADTLFLIAIVIWSAIFIGLIVIINSPSNL